MMQSNRMLQREQVELLAIEKKLLKVVPVIQEALNSLKVEELHLKSLGLERTISESQQVPPSNRTHFDMHETPHMSTPAAMRPDQINQQKIDLDLFISKLEHDEELDSD
ncbi:uncharacterized protein LOC111072081 [Drosophila obscura]|uniref:uncharacterized protein LOC111072081 n=1 Tax=Drosophila obscura TaxID=7282 RepID=UPI000BA061CC|nr:uncharacterized protein LOC111072081 [Drosophila obscura]